MVDPRGLTTLCHVLIVEMSIFYSGLEAKRPAISPCETRPAQPLSYVFDIQDIVPRPTSVTAAKHRDKGTTGAGGIRKVTVINNRVRPRHRMDGWRTFPGQYWEQKRGQGGGGRGKMKADVMYRYTSCIPKPPDIDRIATNNINKDRALSLKIANRALPEWKPSTNGRISKPSIESTGGPGALTQCGADARAVSPVVSGAMPRPRASIRIASNGEVATALLRSCRGPFGIRRAAGLTRLISASTARAASMWKKPARGLEPIRGCQPLPRASRDVPQFQMGRQHGQSGLSNYDGGINPLCQPSVSLHYCVFISCAGCGCVARACRRGPIFPKYILGIRTQRLEHSALPIRRSSAEDHPRCHCQKFRC